MDKKLAKMINSDLKAAYTGEDNVTLSQAIARLCAEFYDPRMVFDNDKGSYTEENIHKWEQMFFLQNIANHLWAKMYDTRMDKKGYVKGVAIKLDRATQHLKNVIAKHDGTEISLNAIDQANDWQDRLQDKLAIYEEQYHMFADMMEVATGMAHKPYQPWTTAIDEAPAASSDKEDALAAKLAEKGIDLKPTSVANTDGVETQEVA